MDGLTPTPAGGARPGDASLVWVTRAAPAAARTAERLRAAGYAPLVAPLLTVRPLAFAAPDLTQLDALAFTSAAGVDAFLGGLGQPAPTHLPVYAVGDATADAARAAGFAQVHSADGAGVDLAKLMLERLPAASRVLHPVTQTPALDLSAVLRAGGLRANGLAVYQSLPADALPPAAADALARHAVSVVLIHSPAAARALAPLLDQEYAPRLSLVALSPNCEAPLAGFAFAARAVASAPKESSLFEALERLVAGAVSR
jgi:uroporphyrinogen-III synthase